MGLCAVLLLLVTCAVPGRAAPGAAPAKGNVFTWDSVVDLLMPSKSVVVFAVFVFCVVVLLAMLSLMLCRFVDCLTDICCNKGLRQQRKMERWMKENTDEPKHIQIQAF